jgi:D-3-phosphoglycerate dehydrogenase
MTDGRPLVVTAGAIHPAGRAVLEAEARVVTCEDLTHDGVVRASAGADGILFRNKPDCSERLMTSCKRLRVVGRYGAGLDIVDLAAATRLGIPVVHAPGSNSDSVAEHAIMLMLSCVKKTRQLDRMTRAGDWNGARASGITELRGKTLGIVGVGNIGRRVARIAGAGFQMRVLGYDPYVDEAELRRRGVEPVGTLEALLTEADIVTCHTPLTPETRGLLGVRAIGLMKPGAIVINTSRGGVQDERALFEALTRGKLRGAGLDVWEEEPASADNPILNLDNVVCTSHIAGVSEEAHRQIAVQVCEEMLRVLRGERPHVLGNPDLWPRLAHLR